MRVKASTAGNIVGKGVPVSDTEVSQFPTIISDSSPFGSNTRMIIKSFVHGIRTVQMVFSRKSRGFLPTTKSYSGWMQWISIEVTFLHFFILLGT